MANEASTNTIAAQLLGERNHCRALRMATLVGSDILSCGGSIDAPYQARQSAIHMAGRKTLWALFGSVLCVLGVTTFVVGALLGSARLLIPASDQVTRFVEIVVWYSALPVVAGMLAIGVDLFFIVRKKRRHKSVRHDPIVPQRVTVALTAYNDEQSIGDAVRDFLGSPFVQRVIVVDNNSTDRTAQRAREAGAIVVEEPRQGYGACVYRALTEAAGHSDTPLTVLCEGDSTFRAFDIPKFLAYMPHADVVNGTRIVEQLQDSRTQISTFIHYGNLAVAKLLEMKYLGDVTLTDVGATYKMLRTSVLPNLLLKLDPGINLEFNPHFLERCVEAGLSVIECPVTFHRRVGVSKGGNASNRKALLVGLRMILGILTSWKRGT